jgi:regulator of cell morphogenesis and NO signaling
MKENEMGTYKLSDTVGGIVAQRPALSRVFESERIDYCCGGKKTLAEVCQSKAIDEQGLLAKLEKYAATEKDGQPVVDAAAMSLAELADHIERTHHGYLREELPRLGRMTKKVAAVHGEHDSRLPEVAQVFLAMADELTNHMMKEERILFPMIRQLEDSETVPEFHCGSLGNPIRMMEMEHDSAGSALERLQEFTNDFTPPEWACNTYRAMLEGLVALERDLHQHIHKENNVLFPRAQAMEAEKRRHHVASGH